MNMSITLAPGEFKVYGNELVTLSNEDFENYILIQVQITFHSTSL